MAAKSKKGFIKVSNSTARSDVLIYTTSLFINPLITEESIGMQKIIKHKSDEEKLTQSFNKTFLKHGRHQLP